MVTLTIQAHVHIIHLHVSHQARVVGGPSAVAAGRDVSLKAIPLAASVPAPAAEWCSQHAAHYPRVWNGGTTSKTRTRRTKGRTAEKHETAAATGGRAFVHDECTHARREERRRGGGVRCTRSVCIERPNSRSRGSPRKKRWCHPRETRVSPRIVRVPISGERIFGARVNETRSNPQYCAPHHTRLDPRLCVSPILRIATRRFPWMLRRKTKAFQKKSPPSIVTPHSQHTARRQDRNPMITTSSVQCRSKAVPSVSLTRRDVIDMTSCGLIRVHARMPAIA